MRDEGHVRHELGAYLLGALEPGERRAVEVHVDTCPGCRDELAQLSGLPSLLDRISVEEARGMDIMMVNALENFTCQHCKTCLRRHSIQLHRIRPATYRLYPMVGDRPPRTLVACTYGWGRYDEDQFPQEGQGMSGAPVGGPSSTVDTDGASAGGGAEVR